jgi:glycosyltransferase involved in cell wall biosynthesis
VVSVLGESRPEKGFRDLPAIADAIAAAPDLARRLRLVVQNWRPFRADGVAHDEVIAALAAQSFVEVVEGELDPDSYRARLDEADVLLLPYDPQIYDLRSSGILVEGLSRGAAVVVRAGGALEEGGEGGLVRAYDAPAELATVLRDLLDDHQMAEARGRAEAFREANSPKRYVRALEARVAGG